jgi:hypothetical protein
MPVISVFFGIAIRMYYEDHDPPHIHAEYQGQRAKFDFEAANEGRRPLERVQPLN